MIFDDVQGTRFTLEPWTDVDGVSCLRLLEREDLPSRWHWLL